MTIQINPIPAFNDNYIWIIHDDSHAVVVDPGTATPVNNYLKQHNLKLIDILITHHHWDHVNGIETLQDQWNCGVYAPSDQRIPGTVTQLKEQDELYLEKLDIKFKVMETPGHTLTHICYFNEQWLFCGDTLFSIGCGRMFEGTPTQYVKSLNKIKKLPATTLVYCTHEYTLSNIAFAISIEPDNKALLELKSQVEDKLNQGKTSLPVVLEQELRLNPFLRVDDERLRNSIGRMGQLEIESDVTCFATLRKFKDHF